MPEVPVAMSITPEMAALEQELQGISNVSPAAINMAAKQYFAPIVNPLVQEGGQRMQQYVQGLQGFLNAPTGETDPLYTQGINTAINNMALMGGQLNANQGMRDYYGTRAENLGALGLQTLQYQQQSKQNLYNQIAQRLAQTNANRWQNNQEGWNRLNYNTGQAATAWDQDFKNRQFDESVRQYNDSARRSAASAVDNNYYPTPTPDPLKETQQVNWNNFSQNYSQAPDINALIELANDARQGKIVINR